MDPNSANPPKPNIDVEGSTPVPPPPSVSAPSGQANTPAQNPVERAEPTPTPIIASKPKRRWSTGVLIGSVLAIVLLIGGTIVGIQLTQEPPKTTSFAGCSCAKPADNPGLSCVPNEEQCQTSKTGNFGCCTPTQPAQTPPPNAGPICSSKAGQLGGPCSGQYSRSCGGDGCLAECTGAPGNWKLTGGTCSTPGDIPGSGSLPGYSGPAPSTPAPTSSTQPVPSTSPYDSVSACSARCSQVASGFNDCWCAGAMGLPGFCGADGFAAGKTCNQQFFDRYHFNIGYGPTVGVADNNGKCIGGLDCGIDEGHSPIGSSSCTSPVNGKTLYCCPPGQKRDDTNVTHPNCIADPNSRYAYGGFGWNGTCFTDTQGGITNHYKCTKTSAAEVQAAAAAGAGCQENKTSGACFDTSPMCGVQQVDIFVNGGNQSQNMFDARGCQGVTPTLKVCNEACTTDSQCISGLVCNKNGQKVCWNEERCANQPPPPVSTPPPSTPPPTTTSFQCQQVIVQQILRNGQAMANPSLSQIRTGDVVTFRGFASAVGTTISQLRFTLTIGGTAQTPVNRPATLLGGQYQADYQVTISQATSYAVSVQPISP